MALKIIIKKRFYINLKHLSSYLDEEWGKLYTDKYILRVYKRIESLSLYPYIGIATTIKDTRTVLVGKQNRIYYRIEKNKLVILNIRDTRKNPSTNPFNKQ